MLWLSPRYYIVSGFLQYCFIQVTDHRSSYVSRGGSLRDRESVPGVVPGAPGRMASWIAAMEPGGAWERDRSFLSADVWHTEGSLTAEPRPAGFPDGPVNHSPGFVRISCCFRQLLQTQITYESQKALSIPEGNYVGVSLQLCSTRTTTRKDEHQHNAKCTKNRTGPLD